MTTQEAPRFIDPVSVMITVNETAVKKGKIPQSHQVHALGISLWAEAVRLGWNPTEGFPLSEDNRLYLEKGPANEFHIQERYGEELRNDFTITPTIDPEGGTHFDMSGTIHTPSGRWEAKGGTIDTQVIRLTKKMLRAAVEVLKVDLTPQPLYKTPKERGVKSSE